MRLDLNDTLANLDRLLETDPQTSKSGGFPVRLQRLRDLLVETRTGEPTLAAIAERVFPGVKKNSLRTTLLEFRKSLAHAAAVASLKIDLVRPDSRGVEAAEIRCYFEGAPLPFAYDSGDVENHLHRENEVIEPRARATRIFVSFAVADQKLSKEFTDQLKVNLPLRFAEPVNLWRFDEKGGILPGEDNEAIIRQRMNESQFGILLVSPAYLSRPFIQSVELPHFIGPSARAHPIPVALADFTPGADQHPMLNAPNIFTYKGKDFYQTPKKERGAFIKALCDHIADLIAKYPSAPSFRDELTSAGGSEMLCRLTPARRPEDGEYIKMLGRPEKALAKSATATEEAAGEGSVPVLETLEAWVKDPDESAYMALLGEAGAGKTMTCAKLAQSLNARRPGSCIYIDLRYLNESGLLKQNPNPKLEEILTATLSRSTLNQKITPERVLQAVREQGALLVWDGLDEVLVHISAQEGDAFFSQLKEVLPPRLIQKSSGKPGRLLIACRTHYFRSFEHEASTLTQAQRGAINATASEQQRSRFRVLRILPFDDDQIRSYLRANVPGLDLERAFDVICKVHNLHDLAQRPYCLSLMRASLPDLDRSLAVGNKIRSVDLYRSLVRSWLARDGTKHRFDEDDKPRLMACLAAWMWREGAKSLTAERLGQWLKEAIIADPTFRVLYGDSFKEMKKRDELLQDFRTATFIARWDGDSFRFAHTSLQEYFLAAHLVRALEEGKGDEWTLPQVNRETLDFAAELFVHRAAESSSARTRLEGTLTILLGESRAGRSENALAFLLRLHSNGESAFVPPHGDFRGLDLTAWEFVGAAKRPLRLARPDFSGAKLIRARFHDVEMAGSCWQGADLCSAEFVGCGLEEADLTAGSVPTRMEGGRFRECRLTGSTISGAIIEGLRVDLPVWDAATEKSWRTALPPDSLSGFPPTRPFDSLPESVWSLGHSSPVTSVALSADGRRIVSGSSDNSVRVWDAHSGECLRVLTGHSNPVWSVALSADGRRIVSGSWDKSVRVWDAHSGECLRVLTGHSSPVMSVALSADGRRIVSGSSDKSVRVWDAHSGECLRVLTGHSNTVWSVALSADGRRIVSGSSDKSVRVWDAHSGAALEVLEEDRKLLEREKAGSDIECARSELGTIRRQADGKELDIAALADGGYAVLERAAGETRWRLARAKGEYWRYVNHATDGPEGRILWSADVLGPVPEV